jgi:hypothetical protein
MGRHARRRTPRFGHYSPSVVLADLRAGILDKHWCILSLVLAFLLSDAVSQLASWNHQHLFRTWLVAASHNHPRYLGAWLYAGVGLLLAGSLAALILGMPDLHERSNRRPSVSLGAIAWAGVAVTSWIYSPIGPAVVWVPAIVIIGCAWIIILKVAIWLLRVAILLPVRDGRMTFSFGINVFGFDISSHSPTARAFRNKRGTLSLHHRR